MGATKLRKRQLRTEEFIQPQATADWTRDDITASAKAIAAMIESSGIREITEDYKIWELDEGVYHVDGTKNANYGAGLFKPYTNYYLFVTDYRGFANRRRFMLFYGSTENNGDWNIQYGEARSNGGYMITKQLSSLKNMGGASSGAAGSAGFAPAPAAGDNTKYLRGDATWHEIPGMVGATSLEAGSAGLVPAPSAGAEGKFLRGNGTWGENVKIYNIDSVNLTVDTSVVDILSDYNNGYLCYLQDDYGGHRLPLYQAYISHSISGGPDIYVVRFGFTNFMTQTKINQMYYQGRSIEGVETWTYYNNSDGTFPGGRNFVGATSSVSGQNGLVPAPSAGSEMKVLRGDGTWANITMYLETVAVGRQQSGLYIYTLEYNSQIISYNEIQTAYQKGVPIVVKNFPTPGLLWSLDVVYDRTQQRDFITFRKVAVIDNKLQSRILKYTVVDNTEYWYEIIEFTTT